MDVSFEWDQRKNRENIKKHGISFSEAMTVFDDPNIQYKSDPDHSQQEEERFLVLGFSERMRILVVCHCYYDADSVIRLISARKANRLETNSYGGGIL